MATSSFSGKTLLAIGACLGAAFSLSAMDASMKMLMSQGITPYFAQGVRGWLILLGMILLMLAQGGGDFRLVRPRAWIMWIRGLLMFSSSLLVFIGISKIELATVTSMIFLYPLIAGVLGAIFFREALGPRRLVFIVVGFLGVVLAAGFTPSTFQVWALVPALGAAIIAIQVVMVRWAPKGMSNLELSYITSAVMAVSGSLFMLGNVPDSITWQQIGLFAIVGVFGTSGTLLLAVAFKALPVGLAGSLNYSSIIFATILAWALFQEVPPARVYFAMALIIAGGLGYMYFQHRAEVAIAKS